MNVSFETCNFIGKVLFVTSAFSLISFIGTSLLVSNLENDNYVPPKGIIKRALLLIGALYLIYPTESLNEEGRSWQILQFISFVMLVIAVSLLFGLSSQGLACKIN
jgi:hypothetical protein